MEELINKIFTEHFGVAISILVIVLFGLVFLIVWAVKVYYGIKYKLDNLPCEHNGNKINSHIEQHTQVDISVTRLTTSIEYIQRIIEGIQQSMQTQNRNFSTDSFTQNNSPLAVSPNGKEMIKRTGLDEMINRNWDTIEKLIRENASSMNPYDIQQYCIEQAVVFPEKFLLENDLNKIKMDAYNSGNSLTSYMKVVAVLSRDLYFKKYNINLEEVDRNDPTVVS